LGSNPCHDAKTTAELHEALSVATHKQCIDHASVDHERGALTRHHALRCGLDAIIFVGHGDTAADQKASLPHASQLRNVLPAFWRGCSHAMVTYIGIGMIAAPHNQAMDKRATVAELLCLLPDGARVHHAEVVPANVWSG
jgi:hypothetical protein